VRHQIRLFALAFLTLSNAFCSPSEKVHSPDADCEPNFSNPVSADFYIAPDGNDEWSGTLANKNESDGPFATLTRARNAVRDLLRAGINRDVRILVRGGTYRIKETIVFGSEDSAPEGVRVTYAAYPGEKPVFSSAVTLDKWKPLDHQLPGVSPKSASRIFVATLPTNVNRFFSLYSPEGRLDRAKGSGFKPMVEGNESGPRKNRFELYFPEGKVWDYENLEDVELISRGGFQWTMNILPIVDVDEEKNVARLGLEATYPLTVMRYVPSRPDNMWVENVLSELDEPNEWALWLERGNVYVFSEDGLPPPPHYAPQVREYFLVQGTPDTPVRGLAFRDLTLQHGLRDVWTEDDVGLQHDWEMWDKDNALVRFRYAEDCEVIGFLLSNSSGGGIRLDRHAQNIAIRNSEISHLGGTGISLIGNAPGQPDTVRENEVINNHIHHIGELYWHNPAIMIHQSGHNRIANNLIHHTPYNGISVGGLMPRTYSQIDDGANERELQRLARMSQLPFWTPGSQNPFDWPDLFPFLYSTANLIEWNEFHNTQEVLGDGNAIYIRMAPPGNVVQRNYFHDIIGFEIAGSLRADGQQSGVLFKENIIFRSVAGGILINFGNDIINNYIVDLMEVGDPSNPKEMPLEGYLKFAAGGRTHHFEAVPISEAVIRSNVLYHLGSRSFIPYSDHSGERRGMSFREANIENNLFWWPGHESEVSAVLSGEQALGSDKGSRVADPGFADLTSRIPDFSIPADSPIHAMGIEPLTIEGMGLDLAVFPKRLLTAVDDRTFEYSESSYEIQFEGLTRVDLHFDTGIPRPFAPAFDFELSGGGDPTLAKLVDGGTTETQGSAKMIRLIDRPGMEHSFYPLLKTDFKVFDPDDTAIISFDLWIDEGQSVNVQTRAHPKLGKTPGPELQFLPSGTINIRQDAGIVGTFHSKEWMHIVITAPLDNRRKYDLRVEFSDGSLLEKKNLGYIDPQLQQITSFVVFRPRNDESGEVRFDNLKIERASQNR
jgi:hypothetical protein